MRILYLTATNSIGAGNRVMLTWISYFLSKNYDVAAICPDGGLLSKSLKKILNQNYFTAEFYNLNKLCFIRNLLRISYFSYKFKPDIIHCNAEISFLYARYIKKFLKIPVAVHIRYHFNPEFYSWIFNPKFLPDKIFFVTKSLLIEEKDKIPPYINENILSYLHNTIYDPYQIDPSLKNISLDSSFFEFGSFGPIQERKNQLALISLAEKFKINKINAKIIVAGFVREQEYFNSFNEKINSLNLTEKN